MNSPRERSWSILLQSVTGASRSGLFLASCLWFLISPTAQAIIDANNNGLSDLWEKAHNTGNLFPSNFDPLADPDGDGWSNAQEAAAGTDPFDANPPDGFLRPEILHTPAVLGDTNGDSIEEVITPEALTVSWLTLTGKQYTLQYSPDLAENTWQDVDSPFSGNGSVTEYHFLADATDRLFWRVTIQDADTDRDGLNDHEEFLFGSSPTNSDTDEDDLTDADEAEIGSDPNSDTSDGDDLPDGLDADPAETLVNWSRVPETTYIVIDVEGPLGAWPHPGDINDRGDVLFGYGIWTGTGWMPRSVAPVTITEPVSPPYSYEIEHAGWNHFNDDRKLLGRARILPTDNNEVPYETISPSFWIPAQATPTLVNDTAGIWDPVPNSYENLGVCSDGSMVVRMNLEYSDTSRIKRFNAAGASIGTMDGSDDYHPNGGWVGHGGVTPSGWVTSNLKRNATSTQAAAYRLGLWNPAGELVSLPAEMDGWGYPVHVTDLPNAKVALTGGKSVGGEFTGRSFLPDAGGNYQFSARLSTKGIELFAGDGTGVTNDRKLWRNGKLTPLREVSERFGEIEDDAGFLYLIGANKHGAYLYLSETLEGEYSTKVLMPFELMISHPEVTGVSQPDYGVSADIKKVLITASALPAADGTIIEWELVEGGGSLSETETTTTDGFASTVLTTSTNVGDSYKVRARVKKLVMPLLAGQTQAGEFDFSAIGYGNVSGITRTTAAIEVVPGVAAAITVERQRDGGLPTTALKADGRSEMTLVATVRDQYGQPVAENTPVVWHLGGQGRVEPVTLGVDAAGRVSAKLTAGNAVGQQKIRIEADGFEITETVDNLVLDGGLSAEDGALDIATGQTTLLTASFPDVADGAKVTWFTSRGRILNAASTVQNGEATATLSAASAGRTGPVLATASVAGTTHGEEVEFSSSAPISVEVEHPVIVGDEVADGSTTVKRLDGTEQTVAYRTSTPVKIKAPNYAGHTATVQFGSVTPVVLANYPMNQVSGGITSDVVGGHHATVANAVLDTDFKHEGAGSMSFNGQDSSLSIADNTNLRIQNGFTVTAWIHAAAASGTIVEKPGEYRIFADTSGHISFAVTTTAGEQIVTGAALPTGRWAQIRAEYAAGGMLSVSVDGAIHTAQAVGAIAPGTSAITVGQAFEGWMDVLSFTRGRQFTAGTGLAISGLTAGQVVLDANGEATLNLASNGSGSVDEGNPVLDVGVRVSINPELEVEDLVQVVTKRTFAVLDATMGEVKLTVSSQNTTLSDGLKDEVVARNLMELKRTGQRSAAIPFEPTGTILERQQFGFRAALFLEETVDGAEKVQLVLENTDRLDLTAEEEARLQQQLTAMLMEAIKGGSDSGAQQHLNDAYGGLINTLAELSEQDTFRAFTLLIDGQTVFFDLGHTHELLGPQVVKDVAKLAKDQEDNPTFGQRTLAIIRTMRDVATGEFQERLYANADEFMRVQVTAAVTAGKLTASEAFNIGFGWGLFEQGQAGGSMTNPFASQRMSEQMAATILAAINGSQEARNALAEAIPLYGLKRMDDAANALAEEGKHFDAGKKSSEFTTASIGSAVVAGQALKTGVTMFRAAKMTAKVRPRVARVPASFGRAPEGMHYRTVFFDKNRKLQPRMGDIEVHHAVDQRSLDLYGNLLSRSEMDSIQNLRGIETGLLDSTTQKPLHQSTIQKHWNRFHKEHLLNGTVPTKQQLLEFATHIDDLYGHLFIPPVR